MTNDEMRIAIAEACGWKSIRVTQLDRRHPNDRNDLPHGIAPNKVYSISEVPDYLDDLNAMFEAENWLINNARNNKGPSWMEYTGFLDRVCRGNLVDHATATQRAEAFLRTVGKWKESE